MISLFLILFLNIWTSPGAAVAIHLPRQGGPNTVYSGRYRIYNCGDQASEVINTLQTLWQVLLPALADANSRTSSDAYNAFFKQVYDAPTVAAVISNITTGAAVIGAHSSRNLLASPIIACANDPSKDPNKNGLLPSKSSRVRALALGYNNCATGQSACRLIGTPMIFLCEDFFAKVFMPSPGQCMSQGHGATNRYTELGGTFTDTQVAILLHEIVHYYADSVFPTPEITLHRQEHYLVNDCLLLDTTTALTNPSSYVYYVFSIYQKCLNFPRLVFHNRVGLLETNTTILSDGPTPILPISNVTNITFGSDSMTGNESITNATSLLQFTDDIYYTETPDEASQPELSFTS